MLLYGARARWGNGRKFRPRYFARLTQSLAPDRVRWTNRLSELPNGGWALVIRAPGSLSLCRELAATHAAGAYVFDQLTPDERHALQRRNGVLVLDLAWDPLIATEEIIRGLVASIEQFGLPTSRIRLLHSNQAEQTRFQTLWRQLTTLEPCANLQFPTSFALGLAYQHANRDPERIEQRLRQAKASLDAGRKVRKFNSFNGELRAHRLHVLAILHQAGLMDQGYVSMLGYSKKPTGTVRRKAGDGSLAPPAIRKLLDELPGAQEVAGSVDALLRMMPLTLDVPNRGGPNAWERTVWSSQHPRFYDQSCFSVVLDSNSNRRDMVHITEKVMKPIINAHPFLYMGNKAGLSQIRALGFETFSPVFDERYDDAPDFSGRLSLFLEELQRLVRMSDDDLTEACLSLWPQCEHNYRHFWGEAFERLRRDFRTDVLDRLL